MVMGVITTPAMELKEKQMLNLEGERSFGDGRVACFEKSEIRLAWGVLMGRQQGPIQVI